MPARLSSQLPYAFNLEGESVRLIYKRMSPTEFAVFDAQFSAYKQGQDAPAMVLVPGAALPPDVVARLEANDAWLREVFTKYVSVAEGDLFLDGQPITTGASLYGLIGSNPALLADALANLYLEHVLTEQEKKTWRSQRDSSTTSRAPNPAAAGPTPVVVAVPVVNEATVPTADATVPSSTSSGTTPADASSCASAPSAS